MRKLLILLALASSYLHAYELSIGSMFRNEAPYLKEWILYHKMVGVEHFYLYNNNSTDEWEEVLQPFMKEGLVEVIPWNQENPQDKHVDKQIAAFKDVLKRASGISSWVALIDIDEFILPMKEATVSECLEKRYKEASGVYVSWRMFGTGGVFLERGENILFKLLSCSSRAHQRNSIGKSIVRPEDMEIDELWYLHHVPPKNGKKYFNGDAEEIEIEHGDLSVFTTHDTFLRINHYYLRDENFFKNVRVHRWEYSEKEGMDRLLQQYNEFSVTKDKTIVNFIKNKHPEEYERIWKTERAGG